MSLQPAPIHRRRRSQPAAPSNEVLVEENLYSSLLVGSGLMASISTAAVLQHAFPACRIAHFPLAAFLGLLVGWVFAVPVVRWMVRRLDSQRFSQVLITAVISGLVLITPAAIFAADLGWLGGVARMYFVAGVLSASGLVWGGYFNCDRLVDL